MQEWVQRQIMCESAVDGQIGYVVDVIVMCVLYREAVREISALSELKIGVVSHSRAGGNPDRGTGFPPARE